MQAMNLARYRELLRGRRTRRGLIGLGVSARGEGKTTVTIAWLGVRVAPAGELGVFVGLAVAAYTLPGVVGALAFGRVLRGRPARALVLLHCLLRTAFLGTVAILWGMGRSRPPPTSGCLRGRRCCRHGETPVSTRCCRSWAGPTAGWRSTPWRPPRSRSP